MATLAISIKKYKGKLSLSETFCKSKFILIYNSENKSENIIKNPYANELGDAGIQSIKFLIENKVDSIIVKNIGINPFRFLTFANIKIYQSDSNSVDEAISNYYNKKLKILENFYDQNHFPQKEHYLIPNI